MNKGSENSLGKERANISNSPLEAETDRNFSLNGEEGLGSLIALCRGHREREPDPF